MIASQVLRDLAGFWTDSGDALSIYFEPSTPSELSHHQETTLAKERIQQAIGTFGRLQLVGSTTPRASVRRAIETIADMEGNHGRAKVIFASAGGNVWREFDLPGKFGVRVDLGKSFTVAPLITQQDNQPRTAILLADRDHARVLLLEAGEITERDNLLAFRTEKVRTTGARKSSHIERSKEDPVRKYFSSIGSQLLGSRQRGGFEGLVVGCRDDLWPEIEAGFPPDLKRIVLGRFRADPGADTRREAQEMAEKVIARRDRNELREVATKAMEEAAAGRLAAMGLANVAQALERNEVRELLLPDPRARLNRAARLCPRCGHLDLESGNKCPLCSAAMRCYPRADEALVRLWQRAQRFAHCATRARTRKTKSAPGCASVPNAIFRRPWPVERSTPQSKLQTISSPDGPHLDRLVETNKPIRSHQRHSDIPSKGGRLPSSSVCVNLMRSEEHAEKGRRESNRVQTVRMGEA